ncbi:MAG: hypothetical protein IMF05_11355, partial [Proteobacteria bacterium]|nr:hypothetical protein [Pseudomonadota bacterium]
MKKLVKSVGFAAALALAAAGAQAQEFTIQPDEAVYDEPDYSPYVDMHFPNRVFWGDTHHHTSNSPDAGLV